MNFKKSLKTPNIKWKYSTKSSVGSSAAVKNEVIFFGTDDGVLHAVDINNGKKIWAYKSSGRRLTKPAIADDSVFFGSDDQHLYAISSESGKELWKFKTGAAITTAPILINKNVLVGSYDHHLYAISSKSGEELWKFNTEFGVSSKPICHNNIIYLADKNNLYALDSNTTKLIWKKRYNILPSNLAISKRLILFKGIDGFMGDQYIYAIEKKTGQLKWKFEGAFSMYGDTRVYKDIVLKNGTSVSGPRGLRTYFYAINIDSGELEWEFILKDKEELFSNFDVNNGTIIFGTLNARDLYALETSTGEFKWKLTMDAGISMRPQPAILEEIALVGTNDGLYAIELL